MDLADAAFAGDIRAVEQLLASGVGVDERGEHGNTPLHYAIENHNVEIVRLLLQHGANTEADTKDGCMSPLLHAIDIDSVAWRERNPPAYPPAEITEILVRAGVDVRRRPRHGTTPLQLARRYGNKAIEALLLGAGAEV